MVGKGTILHFNNCTYQFQSLLALSNAAPVITVKPEELNNNEAYPVQLTPEETSSVIILFKQHEKYTVINGRDNVRKLIESNKPITGRLLSTPAMKKARLSSPEPEVPVSYPSEFANRPRLYSSHNHA